MKTYPPQHTGESYIFHKLSAPKHYWAYVKVLCERFYITNGELEIHKDGEWDVVNSGFRDYCGWYYEQHFRDLDKIGYATEHDARESLPFVKWPYFLQDCLQERWRTRPPNNFYDLFDEVWKP